MEMYNNYHKRAFSELVDVMAEFGSYQVMSRSPREMHVFVTSWEHERSQVDLEAFEETSLVYIFI